MRGFFAAAALIAALLPAAWLTDGAFAAQPPISMREAVIMALKNNASVVNAGEEVRRAEGDSMAKGSYRRPQLSLAGAGEARTDNSDGTRNTDRRTLTAEVSYALYSGGKNGALAEQGRLGVTKAAASFSDSRESIALDVWNGYCAVLYRQSVAAAYKSALDYYIGAEREMVKRVEAGVSTKLDLSRVRQNLANSSAQYITAKNGVDSAKIYLCRLLRIEAKAGIELSESLASLAEAQTEAAGGGELAAALAKRGDYRSLEAQKRIDEKETVVAASGMKPQATLSGGYGYDYKNTAKDFSNSDEWYAKLSLSLPLYDGGKSAGELKSARSKLAQSLNSLGDKKEAIGAELLDCRLTLTSAFESAEAARVERSRAEESLRYAEVGYREGVNTQLDVIQARSDLTEAEKNLAGYLSEYRSAQASYWRAGGALVEKLIGNE